MTISRRSPSYSVCFVGQSFILIYLLTWKLYLFHVFPFVSPFPRVRFSGFFSVRRSFFFLCFRPTSFLTSMRAVVVVVGLSPKRQHFIRSDMKMFDVSLRMTHCSKMILMNLHILNLWVCSPRVFCLHLRAADAKVNEGSLMEFSSFEWRQCQHALNGKIINEITHFSGQIFVTEPRGISVNVLRRVKQTRIAVRQVWIWLVMDFK